MRRKRRAEHRAARLDVADLSADLGLAHAQRLDRRGGENLVEGRHACGVVRELFGCGESGFGPRPLRPGRGEFGADPRQLLRVGGGAVGLEEPGCATEFLDGLLRRFKSNAEFRNLSAKPVAGASRGLGLNLDLMIEIGFGVGVRRVPGEDRICGLEVDEDRERPAVIVDAQAVDQPVHGPRLGRPFGGGVLRRRLA
ncbi:hypothetical protein [Chenggangzhangella methanolivorans]|uniref:hypothetical protein n=1 Tax=Chenggangzhangella methanolivorans TaxID=1437009 RepID=UPI0021BD365F|nr:hypothetical protein [Chenggangzhangella methanolivorans]